MAAIGFAAARRLSEENATTTAEDEGDNDRFVMPFWAIITLVVLSLTLLLCGCTCFVIRCFAPEVTQGPAWEVNLDGTGKKWISGIYTDNEDNDRDPVVDANSSQSYPNGIPVHTPQHDKPHVNDARLYMQPKNSDKRNQR
jgi:hypothetical protein